METAFLAICVSNSVGIPYEVPLSILFFISLIISGCACPRIIGPHEDMKSMYLFPSTSYKYAPLA